jgi:hypothetical protein
MDESPNEFDHPIIERPWEFEVVELLFTHDPGDCRSARIDLTLQNGSHVRRLRFTGVQSPTIEEGFPRPTHGLTILDVSNWQLDGLKVRVTDHEASTGAIRFWARDVTDRDAEKD